MLTKWILSLFSNQALYHELGRRKATFRHESTVEYDNTITRFALNRNGTPIGTAFDEEEYIELLADQINAQAERKKMQRFADGWVPKLPSGPPPSQYEFIDDRTVPNGREDQSQIDPALIAEDNPTVGLTEEEVKLTQGFGISRWVRCVTATRDLHLGKRYGVVAIKLHSDGSDSYALAGLHGFYPAECFEDDETVQTQA